MPLSPLRPVIARFLGQRHGPIKRLISPDDLGDRLKPFIFLDFFYAEIEPGGEEALSFCLSTGQICHFATACQMFRMAQHRYAVCETSEAVAGPPIRRPLACI